MAPCGRFLDIKAGAYGRFSVLVLLSSCYSVLLVLSRWKVLSDILRVAEKLILVVKECVTSDILVLEHFGPD